MDNRGISGVVTTLLLVLLGLVVVGVVWALISGFLGSFGERTEIESMRSDLEIERVDLSSDTVSVLVKRDFGDATIGEIGFVFERNGNERVVLYRSASDLEEGNTKMFNFNLDEVGEFDSVSISPVLISSEGNEFARDVVDSYSVDFDSSDIGTSESLDIRESGKSISKPSPGDEGILFYPNYLASEKDGSFDEAKFSLMTFEGDVNFNGNIGWSDALSIGDLIDEDYDFSNHESGLTEESLVDLKKHVGDVNEDGLLDQKDIEIIIDLYLGNSQDIPSFYEGEYFYKFFAEDGDNLNVSITKINVDGENIEFSSENYIDERYLYRDGNLYFLEGNERDNFSGFLERLNVEIISSISLGEDSLWGDVNQDGSVDEEDSEFLSSLVDGSGYEFIEGKECVDYNYDGVIDETDLDIHEMRIEENFFSGTCGNPGTVCNDNGNKKSTEYCDSIYDTTDIPFEDVYPGWNIQDDPERSDLFFIGLGFEENTFREHSRFFLEEDLTKYDSDAPIHGLFGYDFMGDLRNTVNYYYAEEQSPESFETYTERAQEAVGYIRDNSWLHRYNLTRNIGCWEFDNICDENSDGSIDCDFSGTVSSSSQNYPMNGNPSDPNCEPYKDDTSSGLYCGEGCSGWEVLDWRWCLGNYGETPEGRRCPHDSQIQDQLSTENSLDYSGTEKTEDFPFIDLFRDYVSEFRVPKSNEYRDLAQESGHNAPITYIIQRYGGMNHPMTNLNLFIFGSYGRSGAYMTLPQDLENTERHTNRFHELFHSLGGLGDEYFIFGWGDVERESLYQVYAADSSLSSEEMRDSCYENAPWKNLIGDGCGEPGVIDCVENKDDMELNPSLSSGTSCRDFDDNGNPVSDEECNLEIGCWRGALGGNTFRSTPGSIFTHETYNEYQNLGLWNTCLQRYVLNNTEDYVEVFETNENSGWLDFFSGMDTCFGKEVNHPDVNPNQIGYFNEEGL